MKQGFDKTNSDNQNNEEKKFSSFEDFKNAVLTLPQDLLPPFLKKEKTSPKQPFETATSIFDNLLNERGAKTTKKAENESENSRIFRLQTAIKELYHKTTGLTGNHAIRMMESSNEEIIKMFKEDIFFLWDNRGEKEPIKIISFNEIKIEQIEKQLEIIKKQIDNFEKHHQEITNKLKTMKPKNKKIYLKDIKNKPNKEQLISTKESLEKDIETLVKNTKKTDTLNELMAKKIINERMPYLSGKEYFQVYIDVINNIGRYNKEFKRKLENIIVEWASKHKDEPPLKMQNKKETRIEQTKQQIELTSVQKKVLEELWRIYSVVEQNPNPVNLEHANLVLQNLLRVLEKK